MKGTYIRKRTTAVIARNRPSLLHPWSHLPSVAVPLDSKKLDSESVSLTILVGPVCCMSSSEARLSAMQEQFSNTGLCHINRKLKF